MSLVPKQDNWLTKNLKINRGHSGLPKNASEVPYLFSQPSNEAANNLKFNPYAKRISLQSENKLGEADQYIKTDTSKGSSTVDWNKPNPLGISKKALKMDKDNNITGTTTIDYSPLWDKEKFKQISSSLDLFMKGIGMAGGKGLLTRR